MLRARISGLSAVRYGALLAVAALGGCSVIAPDVEPEEIAVVVVPAEPPPPAPVIKPKPKPEPEPPKLQPVAVVLSSSQPVFQDVANALTKHLEDFQVFDLSDSSQPPVSVLRVINDSDSSAVIAIGLRAAQSSVAMSDTPVIFSQVFNHQDHDLLGDNSRAVAPLAPLDAQLAAWTKNDPTISRIGIIVGEGHDALIEEAQLAAQKHKVELHIRIAASDQETLYIFRRMVQDIDGFWLFPDNRVLSNRSLREILKTAKRNQVAVAVPSESMLKIGATISLATEAEDIAATIAGIIRKLQSEGLASIPSITPLSAIRVVTQDAERVVKR
jgi:ABC-type uncharacterized transport system substrate-binding protein